MAVLDFLGEGFNGSLAGRILITVGILLLVSIRTLVLGNLYRRVHRHVHRIYRLEELMQLCA